MIKTKEQSYGHHTVSFVRRCRRRFEILSQGIRLPEGRPGDEGRGRQDQSRVDEAWRGHVYDGMSGFNLSEPETARAGDAKSVRQRGRCGQTLRARQKSRRDNNREACGHGLRSPALRRGRSRRPSVVLRARDSTRKAKTKEELRSLPLKYFF